MSGPPLPRPAAGEYDAYYAGYIARVPGGDILEILETQWAATRRLLERVTPEGETYRYTPGKWSVREVVGHCVDVEWTFAYRALWMARGGAEGLPGMDQDAWARASRAGDRALAELVEEWEAVRRSALLLFGSLDAAEGARRGTASGLSFTVRTFPWLAAGHELHHRLLLEERYAEALAP